MAIIMLVIPLNSFASQATNTEQAELQTLIRELNKKCPKDITSEIFYKRDSNGNHATLKRVACNNSTVRFDIQSISSLRDWENDKYAQMDGIKDGLLHFYILGNGDLFERIEALYYSAELVFTWKDKTTSTFTFTNQEICDVLYSWDREQLEEYLNDITEMLPMDMSRSINNLLLTDAQHRFRLVLESVHPNGKVIDWVQRISLNEASLSKEIKDNLGNNYDLWLAIQYIIINGGYDSKELYSLICECGYGIRHTMIIDQNTSKSFELSHRQLKQLMDELDKMSDKDKLGVLYKYIYAKNIKLPYKVDENETVVSIDYDNQYWIETREVSPDIFDIFKNNPEVKGLYLTNLCTSNRILTDYLSELYCDYKVIFINKQTRQQISFIYTASDIDAKYDELYDD